MFTTRGIRNVAEEIRAAIFRPAPGADGGRPPRRAHQVRYLDRDDHGALVGNKPAAQGRGSGPVVTGIPRAASHQEAHGSDSTAETCHLYDIGVAARLIGLLAPTALPPEPAAASAAVSPFPARNLGVTPARQT